MLKLKSLWQIRRREDGVSVVMWVILAALILVTVIVLIMNNSGNGNTNPATSDYTKYLGNTNRVLSVSDIANAQNKFANSGKIKTDWKPKQPIIGDQYLGSTNAKATVVQYEDFACSACTAFESSLEKIHNDYANKSVLFIYRNFSMGQSTSTISEAGAQAAYVASGNNMTTFWNYVKLVYAGQFCVEGSDKTACQNGLVQSAKSLGVNVNKFNDLLANFATNGIQDKLNRDKNIGTALNVNATPTFIVSGANGSKTIAGGKEADLRSAIDAALK